MKRGKTDIIEMNQQCKVCEEPAAGFHFGAFTCEGCKSFFGRAHTNPAAAAAAECKTGAGRCVIDKKNRTSCKACRLKKCLAAGMSKSGSRYGRRSNWFKIHCLVQQQRHRGARGHQTDRGRTPPSQPPRRSLPVPQPQPSLQFFRFAPIRWAPLPRSEHSAFRETARSDDDDIDLDDDLPVDLSVVRKLSHDGDNNNNNDTLTGKYVQDMSAAPLDLTRTGRYRSFGIST